MDLQIWKQLWAEPYRQFWTQFYIPSNDAIIAQISKHLSLEVHGHRNIADQLREDNANTTKEEN